jgi:hypothetical protein
MKLKLLALASLFLPLVASAQLQVYSLEPTGTPADQPVLNASYVTGISIRQTWAKMEPNAPVNGQHTYDFSFFTGEIGRAQQYGKLVELRVFVEAANAPSWVMAGSQTYNPPDGSSMIWVYWDPFGESNLQALYQALGQTFGSNPTVSIVVCSCDTQDSGDWSMPCTPQDVTKWTNATFQYTPQKNITACNSDIDVIAAAFPKSKVTVACGQDQTLDPSENYVCDAIAYHMATTLGTRAIIQKNQFKAVSPTPINAGGTNFEILSNWMMLMQIGGQASWSVYGDTSYWDNGGVQASYAQILANLMQEMGTYGVTGPCELYQIDIENLPKTIEGNLND